MLSPSKEALTENRHALLKALNTEADHVAHFLAKVIERASKLPDSSNRKHELISDCRELLYRQAGLIWDCLHVQMLLEGRQLPDWQITDALHHPVLDRYAFIRLDERAGRMEIILESFDTQGNGRLERIGMSEFEPAQWDVIPRHIYNTQLELVLSTGMLSWKELVNC